MSPPHSVVPEHRTRSHTMNIQNAAGAVTFSVLSGVLLNVLLPVGASNATVDAGPARAGLKDKA